MFILNRILARILEWRETRMRFCPRCRLSPTEAEDIVCGCQWSITHRPKALAEGRIVDFNGWTRR